MSCARDDVDQRVSRGVERSPPGTWSASAPAADVRGGERRRPEATGGQGPQVSWATRPLTSGRSSSMRRW